jgi:16S rRNA G966 N2-methylase RsmD
MILEKDLLSQDRIINIETDDDARELQEIKKLDYNIEIINQRTYGRVKLIFLKKEERG